MNKRRVVVIAAACLLGLVVVGWVAAFALSGGYGTTGASTQTTVSAPDSGSAIQREATTGYSAGTAPGAPQDAAKGLATSEEYAPTANAAVTERQIIRTATVTLTVKQVPAAMEKLRVLVAAAGGEISSLSYSAGVEQPVPLPMAESGSSAPTGPQSATVVVRVPASKLVPLTRTVAGLGEVTAQTAGQEDITAQVVDLEARLKNMRAEEVRLRSFLNKANRVSDMLSIERELSRVRGEIESMQAQQRLPRRPGRDGDPDREHVSARPRGLSVGYGLGLRRSGQPGNPIGGRAAPRRAHPRHRSHSGDCSYPARVVARGAVAPEASDDSAAHRDRYGVDHPSSHPNAVVGGGRDRGRRLRCAHAPQRAFLRPRRRPGARVIRGRAGSDRLRQVVDSVSGRGRARCARPRPWATARRISRHMTRSRS